MNANSYLVVDRRGSSLELHGRSITVRCPDERPLHIPARHVGTLVLVGSVTVDTRVLTRLSAQGSGIIILPGRGTRAGSLLHGLGHGDVVRRIGQYRIVAAGAGLPWAKRIVRIRINSAFRLLGTAMAMRPDLRHTLFKTRSGLRRALSSAHGALSIEQLMGIEGAAAASFFRAYGAVLPDSCGFAGRNRRPPRDPANAALSLGYTLLHADAAAIVVSCGLDPMIGFLHQPTYGRDSLACDVTEIGRANVERMVWRLFAERRLTSADFTIDGSGCRLNKRARGAFFAAYGAVAPAHRRSMQRVSRLLAGHCDATGISGAATYA